MVISEDLDKLNWSRAENHSTTMINTTWKINTYMNAHFNWVVVRLYLTNSQKQRFGWQIPRNVATKEHNNIEPYV